MFNLLRGAPASERDHYARSGTCSIRKNMNRWIIPSWLAREVAERDTAYVYCQSHGIDGETVAPVVLAALKASLKSGFNPGSRYRGVRLPPWWTEALVGPARRLVCAASSWHSKKCRLGD
jgi:hypothetical protein